MFTVGQLRKRLASYPDDTLILTLGDLFAPSTVQAAHAAFSSRVSLRSSPSVIGRNLKRLRTSLGFTQYKLATLVDDKNFKSISVHLSQIESGRIKQPHLNTLNKLCKALNCSIEDLTQGE